MPRKACSPVVAASCVLTACATSALVLVLACLASPASAVPFRYTYSFIGTGSLDDVRYADALVEMSFDVDTEDLEVASPTTKVYFSLLGTIAIDGTSFDILEELQLFFNDEEPLLGLERAGGQDLLFVEDDRFLGWDFVSPIFVADATVLFNELELGESLSTSGGDFTTRIADEVVDFSAVPEPSTLLLVALGSLTIGLQKRSLRCRRG